MTAPRVHALFQNRIDGDDALLHLARLRFAQAGLAAEVYAHSLEELDRILGFLPPHPHLPVVHLDRGVDLLHESDRAMVAAFASRFAGRIFGLVVHDRAEMADRTDALVAAVQELTAPLEAEPDTPWVFLEYAAGLELDWFVGVGERLREVAKASLCLDIGHIGIKHAHRVFSRTHPDLDLATLSVDDPRLPALVDDVQDAVKAALPAVLETTDALGPLGKPLHFHLHDGHPLIRGLSDHASFLTWLSVPFDYQGRRSLNPMYGPSGAARIVTKALEACGPERVSFTLEIHEGVGRLPLGDAAGLFPDVHNVANAERMNHWLAVLAQNSRLIADAAPVDSASATRRP